jgi:hypothetical protein
MKINSLLTNDSSPPPLLGKLSCGGKNLKVKNDHNTPTISRVPPKLEKYDFLA